MAKIDYKVLADDIIERVGGVANIREVSHCVTRLRFLLKDKNLVNEQELKALKGVLGTVYGSGQYQIILGENLFPVYDSIEKNYDIQTGAVVDETHTEDYKLEDANVEKNFKYYFTKVIQFMSASLTPSFRLGLLAENP